MQVVDVLVLVDQDIAEPAHQLLAQIVLAFDLALAFEQLDGLAHHLGEPPLLDGLATFEARTR
ncbi:hypothetical protein D3C77_369680 [compost metagenome]